MKILRMFSNVEEEKLYSTGNDELDELLERAFCEGYEYAQREFTGAKYLKNGLIGNILNDRPDRLLPKSEQIKKLAAERRKAVGGVVGRPTLSDKSFYQAKTLSPKRNAKARNPKHNKQFKGDELNDIAKELEVKK